MKYYNVSKNWRKAKPHIENKRVQDTLVANFRKYTFGRWKEEFKHGNKPHEFESCDWWCERRGKMPEFFGTMLNTLLVIGS